MTVHGLFISQCSNYLAGSVIKYMIKNKRTHNRPRSRLVAREERRILAPFPEAERVQWLGNLWPKHFAGGQQSARRNLGIWHQSRRAQNVRACAGAIAARAGARRRPARLRPDRGR